MNSDKPNENILKEEKCDENSDICKIDISKPQKVNHEIKQENTIITDSFEINCRTMYNQYVKAENESFQIKDDIGTYEVYIKAEANDCTYDYELSPETLNDTPKVIHNADENTHGYIENNENHNGLLESPYHCSKCDKCFRTESNYINHLNNSNNNCNQCGNEFDKVIVEGRSQYRCLRCNNFNSSSSSDSQQRYSILSTKKPFTCHNCNRSFKVVYYLSKHLLKNSCEKPFTCHLCKHSFSGAKDLSIHVKTHLSACIHCGNHFSKGGRCLNRKCSGQLKRLPKSYNCHVCNEKFNSTEDRKRHVQLHLIKCVQCSRLYYKEGPCLNKHCPRSKIILS